MLKFPFYYLLSPGGSLSEGTFIWIFNSCEIKVSWVLCINATVVDSLRLMPIGRAQLLIKLSRTVDFCQFICANPKDGISAFSPLQFFLTSGETSEQLQGTVKIWAGRNWNSFAPTHSHFKSAFNKSEQTKQLTVCEDEQFFLLPIRKKPFHYADLIFPLASTAV